MHLGSPSLSLASHPKQTLCQLSLDLLHGQGFKGLTAKGAQYPIWFPTCVGLWQLSVATLNFYGGGAHRLLAQRMLAVLMGGVVHHHAVGEKHPSHSIGGLIFLALSVAVPVLSGEDAAATTGLALALAAVGYGMGVAARSLAGGKGKAQ